MLSFISIQDGCRIKCFTGVWNIDICWLRLQTLGPSITNVRNAIDKALAERDANIDKFCTHLDKDIAELGKEVKEVKQEAQVTTFYTHVLKQHMITPELR